MKKYLSQCMVRLQVELPEAHLGENIDECSISDKRHFVHARQSQNPEI